MAGSGAPITRRSRPGRGEERSRRARHDEERADERARDEEPAADEYGEDAYEEDEYDEETYDESAEDDEYDDEDPPADEGESDRRRRSGRSGIGPASAAQAAMGQVAELTGKKHEGVTAVTPADNGWLVGVEVVEDRRVPSSADVMAIYEAEISADGDLMSYRRASRYSRGRGDHGGGS